MILGPEADQYPADLFEVASSSVAPEDGIPSEPAISGCWWLIHTKPRCEKAFARRMFQLKQPFYLPCRMTRKKTRGRIQESFLPVFSGYAFLYATESSRVVAYQGDHVAKLVAVSDQERLWQDLRLVRKILDLGTPVQVEDRIIPGQRVRLRNGPLVGMTGTILREAGRERFVVEVHLIQRGLSVTVDASMLGVVSQDVPVEDPFSPDARPPTERSARSRRVDRSRDRPTPEVGRSRRPRAAPSGPTHAGT